jgi:hypothetical protein
MLLSSLAASCAYPRSIFDRKYNSILTGARRKKTAFLGKRGLKPKNTQVQYKKMKQKKGSPSVLNNMMVSVD